MPPFQNAQAGHFFLHGQQHSPRPDMLPPTLIACQSACLPAWQEAAWPARSCYYVASLPALLTFQPPAKSCYCSASLPALLTIQPPAKYASVLRPASPAIWVTLLTPQLPDVSSKPACLPCRPSCPAHCPACPPCPAGAQEGHSQSHSEHLWLHRQGHWAPGCAGHAAEQLEGPGAPEQGLHDCGHCHCCRDLLALHRAASTYE